MSDIDPLQETDGNPFGPKLQRYWDQRHTFFLRFDEGIQIDKEGLYSVKPEQIALEIGLRTRGNMVLDAFCGVAGSAIGFVRAGKTVIATDINPSRLSMSEHNAAIYEVDRSITFLQSDALEAVRTLDYNAVYLDPPWGGPEYIKREFFNFESFDPNPKPLIEEALRRGKEVVITVPLNFDYSELESLRVDHQILLSQLDKKPIFNTIFIEPS